MHIGCYPILPVRSGVIWKVLKIILRFSSLFFDGLAQTPFSPGIYKCRVNQATFMNFNSGE